MSTDPTGTEAAGVDPCPHCGTTSGTQLITGTPPKVLAWTCGECGTEWAVSVVNPRSLLDHLTATVERVAARSVLREIITLADDALGYVGTTRFAGRGHGFPRTHCTKHYAGSVESVSDCCD